MGNTSVRTAFTLDGKTAIVTGAGAGANVELKGPVLGPGRIPLGKMGDPEEIEMAVLFCASPASRVVAGQLLTVDGGFQVS
ncbi:SDR family oxidoreductase [Ideonella sp. B508-1]|uniref:SDR family oxidoreductase n=1 Tax=Ideonella sp. B508-1 TaxID=137716 RepID=UPI00034A3B6D|nr:SDR family oxidoreductase [Ideonella sp. B508-1]